MSKGDLITAIANRAGLTKKAAADALEAFIDTVSGELTNGEQVTITGFGTFKVSHRAARTGVNPQNPSQKIQIKASKVPTFKAGKNLKEAVN
ncbi:HU family DNA-binding protein [bacterium]|nr:HU family DNA-binding protein [bacterium]NCQ55743.1 HU family DNA-binding protein [Candidatus Parcubacteria bacterium]NCS67692.1 HU family DNA-binding protein [Candidatus Peregrinibacteria bacterium]NCS96706.1 HU family DNA-binding protein [bacterium]